MKLLLSFLTSICLLAGCATVSPTPNKEFETLRQATWRVEIMSGKYEAGSCSGVFIAPEKMLTAAHCDSYGTDGWIRVAGKKAVVLKKDEAKDLMLLYVPLRSKTVAVSERLAVLDESVVVVGFPLGIGPIITEGRSQGVLFIPEAGGPERFLAVSAPISGGSSGGPVFIKTDKGYKVAGIASRGGGTVYLFVDVHNIYVFLHE